MFELLSPRQSRSDDRDRGVSEIIGAILIFGLLLLLLVVVQATAVPAWNQQEEFEHSQRVQSDLQTLDADADAVAADGTPRTTVVEAGVRYPSRPFLLNPPPASGQLRVEDSGTLAVENADLVGVDNYWNETSQQYETSRLTYEADYREYANGPTAYYENGVLYNDFGGETLYLSDHPIVDGSTIDLRTLDGDYQRATDGTASLDLRPTSAPAQSVQIRSANANDPIVLRIPTRLDAQTLREETFANQIDPGADADPEKHVQSVSVTNGVARIELEPGEYTLRMSEVGVGQVPTEGATYVTSETTGALIQPDTTTDLTAEVRDQYNNPVAGVDVTFAVTDTPADGQFADSKTTTTTVTTGPDGTATAVYEAPAVNATDSVTATASVDADPTEYPDAGRYEWSVETNTEAPGGGATIIDDDDGEGPEDAVSSINPAATEGVPALDAAIATTNQGTGVLTMCFVNDGGTDWQFSESRISYFQEGNSDKTSATVTEVDGTTISNGPVLLIPGDYVNTATDIDTIDGGDKKSVELTFDTGFSNNEFMIFSVRFADTGTGDELVLSYFVPAENFGVPNSATSCP